LAADFFTKRKGESLLTGSRRGFPPNNRWAGIHQARAGGEEIEGKKQGFYPRIARITRIFAADLRKQRERNREKLQGQQDFAAD
jgi:hypothetical protein